LGRVKLDAVALVICVRFKENNMIDSTIVNAVITSAHIRFEYDCLTVRLTLDYGDACQGFGGHVLMTSPTSPHRETTEHGPNYAGVYIDGIMRTVGVSEWNDLKGKPIRVACSSESFDRVIFGIGHVIKDRWFFPKAEFDRLQKKTPTLPEGGLAK